MERIPSKDKSTSQTTSILVELGLSKSQIKQLPKSITDEADFIDGVRKIVSELPDGVRKDIMQQGIVEAIELFKANLLEQDDVELTEEQKKEIEDYKSKEEEEQKEKQDKKDQEPKDDEPKDEPKDDEPKDDEPKDDEPKDDEPKDDEPKDDEPKEPKGGEDLPKTTTTGGGGNPPIDIPDDAYPIFELPQDVKETIAIRLLLNKDIRKNSASTNWDRNNFKFFNLTLEDWVFVWALFKESGAEDINPKAGLLGNPNLFSIMKVLWEFHKGYKARVLDRYYIYSQYASFLMFVAAAPHTHTDKYGEEDKDVWKYVPNSNMYLFDAFKLYRIPNYFYAMILKGYYTGEANEVDYLKFAWSNFLVIPYNKLDDERLKKILKFAKSDSSSYYSNTYYTNNYNRNASIVGQQFTTSDQASYYYEAYADLKYIQSNYKAPKTAALLLDDDKIVTNVSKLGWDGVIEPFSSRDNGEKHFIKFKNESVYFLFNVIRKINDVSPFVSNPYNFSFPINDGLRRCQAINVFATLSQYLKLNSPDNFTITFAEADENLLIHNQGSSLDLDTPIFLNSLGVIPTYDYSPTNFQLPFPIINNSLFWTKKAAITVPPTAPKPPKKTRTKKQYTAKQQEIVDEIEALKQALKYTSGADADSIKEEIEALKQSLKYI